MDQAVLRLVRALGLGLVLGLVQTGLRLQVRQQVWQQGLPQGLPQGWPPSLLRELSWVPDCSLIWNPQYLPRISRKRP